MGKARTAPGKPEKVVLVSPSTVAACGELVHIDEERVISQLNHPNIVHMHDFGVTMLWESLDYGQNWQVISSGPCFGSFMWFEPDIVEPDMLWVAYSRSLFRLRHLREGERQATTTKNVEGGDD